MKRKVVLRGMSRVNANRMSRHQVRANGSVVIDSAIRRQLGIKPGWETLQWVENGRVVLEFLPPVEPGGAFGSLKPTGDTSWLETEEALNATIEQAVGEVALEQEAKWWASHEKSKRKSTDTDEDAAVATFQNKKQEAAARRGNEA